MPANRFEELIGEKKVDSILQHFVYLYDRWQNEREYEDFGEYKKSFEKVSGYKIVKMLKRPFKVIFFVGEEKFWIKITSTTAHYGGFC